MQRGDRLPSYRDLGEQLGMAYTTVKFAMDDLAKQGVIRRQPAKGCYVNQELARPGRSLRTIGLVHMFSRGHLLMQPYLTQILHGINSGPADADVHIFTLREHGLVDARQVADHRIDGVIAIAVENDHLLQGLADLPVPVVVVEHVPRRPGFDHIACDNAGGTRQAIAHLHGLGHRHIRYVGNIIRRPTVFGTGGPVIEVDQTDHEERRAAACAILSATPQGWDEVTVPAAGEEDFLRDVVARWRQEADRPTAFLADDEWTAGNLIRCLGEVGVAVPDGVSVCAVACTDGSDDGLAGCHFDFAGMGQLAVARLEHLCQHPEATVAGHRVGFTFRPGSSAAPISA